MNEIEKMEAKNEFNGIDEMKKALSNIIDKVNEIIDSANERSCE